MAKRHSIFHDTIVPTKKYKYNIEYDFYKRLSKFALNANEIMRDITNELRINKFLTNIIFFEKATIYANGFIKLYHVTLLQEFHDLKKDIFFKIAILEIPNAINIINRLDTFNSYKLKLYFQEENILRYNFFNTIQKKSLLDLSKNEVECLTKILFENRKIIPLTVNLEFNTNK